MEHSTGAPRRGPRPSRGAITALALRAASAGAREGPRLLLFLDEIDPAAEASVGGKAAHLARLARAGLPVPPGFVVTVEDFRRFLDQAGRDGRAVATARLPEGLVAELARALQRLPGGPEAHLAVRSSGHGEDAAGRSYAGQYDSFLGVRGLPALEDAVRATWASWFSERARLYRTLAGGAEPAAPGMAVLVQLLVQPRAAGVLFTVNPKTGSTREVAVESVLGLAHGLASGTQEADLFVVRRPPAPRRWGHLSVRDRHVAVKVERHRAAPGGGVDAEPVPEAERGRPSLSDAHLLDLCRLALRAEDLFGVPLDVEWAVDDAGRVHLLQARPVTASARPNADPPASRPVRSGILYTQRFSGERWNEPVTPLSWSLIEPVLHWFVRWEDAESRFLEGTPPTRLYRGMPYFNMTLFRSLVFRVPGWAPPQFLLEFFPADEQEELRARASYPPDLRVVTSIFSQVFRERRHERYAWDLLRNHEEWDRFQPQMERRTAALDTGFSSVDEGFAQVDAARQLMLEYVRIHLLSLLFANIYYQALSAMLGRWAGDSSQATLAALTTEPSGNRTVLCNKALWKLAADAAASTELADALARPSPPPPPALRGLPGGPAFLQALDRFLAQYGHRSSASWEVFSRRWAEDPQAVLGLVGAYLRGGIRTDPFLQEDRQLEERDRVHRDVRRRLAGAPLRRLAFDRALGLTRRYMVLRENQRFCFDGLLYRLKQVFGRLGEVLHARGALDDPDLLPFLTLEQARELADASPARRAELRGLAEARRAQRELDRDAWHPDFLYGDEPPEDAAPVPSRRLAGLGISPGRVRGPVRVLRNLEEVSKLRRGDILVTRATDPGWTPLFLTVGGLVMELGSLLSHGAVVAREYRLPAVVNIAGATRLLQDGQEVTVDGATGVVFVHAE